MTKEKITNWNKRNKISLYDPLAANHSIYGEVKVLGISDKSFCFSTSRKELKEKENLGRLCFSFTGGEELFFEGDTLLLESSREHNLFEFYFEINHFSDSYHKVLIKLRKNQHIAICQHEDVEASDKFTGFSRLNFLPEALPELDEKDIKLGTKLLGRDFSYPFFITGMTGGIEEGQRINENLAENAVSFNIPMGIGSQRMAMEFPEYAKIFILKEKFPELFLFGNIGFSDLLKESDPVSYCKKAIEMIKADAFAIHLNVVQECVQVEGNRDFKGFFKLLEKICQEIETPIMIKEVGSGITPKLAKALENIGVSVLDIGGKGGTSWSKVESYRVSSSEARLGNSFRDWGAPTAFSLAAIKDVCSKMEVTATGGFRDGQTIAKACALGANSCGLGLPLFKAALQSKEEVKKELELIASQLHITMLATGSASLKDLQKKLVLGHPLEKEFNTYLKRLGTNCVK